MDPGSIVGIVAFSTSVLSKGYSFLEKCLKAPKETRQLLSEVSALNSVLDQLRLLAETTEAEQVKGALQHLAQTGAIERCRDLLGTASGIIEKCIHSQNEPLKNFSKRLLWPLKEKDTNELLERFHALRETLSSALAIDASLALRRLESTTADIRSDTRQISEQLDEQKLDAERQRLYNWLLPSVSNSRVDYEAAVKSRHKGTGAWFLETKEFIDWLNTENGLLWIYANPGSGKTILSATIIEYLQDRYKTANSALAYYYFNHASPEKQQLQSMIQAITEQVLQANAACYIDVKELYTKKEDMNMRQANDNEYAQLLASFSSYFDKVFVVIDALDEADSATAVTDWVALLRKTFVGNGKVRILATSRREMSIEKAMSFQATHTYLLTKSIGRDIEGYVSDEVQSLVSSGHIKLKDPNLKKTIIEKLLEDAGGMFLWAKLQITSICRLRTDRAIKHALESLPHDLDETYIRILRNILDNDPESAEDVRKIFCWLIGAEQPLTLEKLAEAVSIQEGDTKFEPDGIATNPEDLIYACGGLVTIFRRRTLRTAQFSHHSVQNFLQSPRIRNTPASFFAMDQQTVHEYLAKTCTQYIGFYDFEQPCPGFWTWSEELKARLETYTLMSYACLNWPAHLRKCSQGMAHTDWEKFLRHNLNWFLAPTLKGTYDSWEQVLRVSTVAYSTGLPQWQHAVAFGLSRILDIILASGSEINEYMDGGLAALHVCALWGYTDVAQKLLNAGAVVDIDAIQSLKTPLRFAAEECHLEMVKLLLQAGAHPDKRGSAGSSPFYGAARGGSIEILNLLYQAGADVNVRTYDNWTPLIEAVEHGHHHAAERLVEMGADVHVVNDQGWSAETMALASKDWAMLEIIRKGSRQLGVSATWTEGVCNLKKKLTTGR